MIATGQQPSWDGDGAVGEHNHFHYTARVLLFPAAIIAWDCSETQINIEI